MIALWVDGIVVYLLDISPPWFCGNTMVARGIIY